MGGWTKTDNAILDEYMPIMGDAELRVVLAVNRQTVGRNKEEARISISLMQTLTGLSKAGAVSGTAEAIKRGIIKRRQVKNSYLYRITVNEVDRKVSTKLTVNEIDSQRSRQKSVNEIDSLGVNEIDTYKESNKRHKKEGERSKIVLDDGDGFDGPAVSPSPKSNARITATDYDPRKVSNGHVPQGKGATPLEVLFEFRPVSDMPTHSQRKKMAEHVSDLGLWREVIDEWDGRGFKLVNVKGMLEWYSNPQKFRNQQNGKATGRNQKSTNGRSSEQHSSSIADEAAQRLRESGFTLTVGA